MIKTKFFYRVNFFDKSLSPFEPISSLQKSLFELWEFRLEQARALTLFTSSLKKSSSLELELEPRLGPTSTFQVNF